MRPHVDDIRAAKFAIIQLAGFDGKPVAFDPSRRGEDMRMMIALISVPVRGMNGNIGNHAVPFHKIGRETERRGLDGLRNPVRREAQSPIRAPWPRSFASRRPRHGSTAKRDPAPMQVRFPG